MKRPKSRRGPVTPSNSRPKSKACSKLISPLLRFLMLCIMFLFAIISPVSKILLLGKNKELSTSQRLHALHLLLEKSENGVLKRGATTEIAAEFGVNLRSIQRLWKRAKDSGTNIHVSYRVKNCGRKIVDFDLDQIRDIPLSERTTIRSLAFALGVSKTYSYSKLKEGSIRRHTNAIKPLLTSANEISRMIHCLDSFLPSSLPHDPTFNLMENTVHIDKKWFYLTRKTQTYYMLPDQPDPVRTCKSLNFIPKVMFLAAVARPRFDCDGICTFDGKIGVFPLVQSVAAVRSSRNRPRGTVEIKPLGNITRNVIREFMISKVLPAIVAKWPRDSISNTIYIQQDNAKSHISTDDDEFLYAVQQSGMTISLVCQPPNSPDLNVLDLGFFRAIQSLQSKDCCKTMAELIEAVDNAFLKFAAKKSNHVFLSLQACMIEILKCNGANNYRIPHIKKDQLERQGILPSSLHCSREIYDNSVEMLSYLR